MNERMAGTPGGLSGGLVIGLATIIGRRTHTLHRTLDKASEDWLDRTASAAFGYAYGMLRGRLPNLPSVVLGGLYGTGLYVVAIAGIAPLVRITRGEQSVSGRVRGERLSVHVLYGLLTAIVADVLRAGRGHA